ncbi:hypothetical protein GIB67_007234 [Kingdonia uniflora]|uniref:FAS1 domain-containing protein n=1 Tax=Kingdonia uniflora TaxID=39325 RepID=A0A7J7NXA0_9MAGN|nr:hypothetical protein GIB67_007234 [Kingdonia uniflora]
MDSSTIEASTTASDFFNSDSSPASSPSSSSFSHESAVTFTPTTLLEPILTNLGFQELAMAVPSLSDSAYTTWNGPSTIFAPSDSSIRTCVGSCSVPQLLREHIVPGIFSIDYLRKLAFGTKLETMSPGRCITITSASNVSKQREEKIIFVGGVEITHPDVFYNGLIVVHRLQGFISHLSPFSCNVERVSSLSFSPQPQPQSNLVSERSPAIMRLMLRDAMLRLHNNGFSILSLGLRVKYSDLIGLQNVTIFALEDATIFAGGHSFVSHMRFHIVPNRLLMYADLMKLSAGTMLPTLEPGQNLLVTSSGGAQMRINYVRIKSPDVMYNLKIVVHSVFLPFPHLHPVPTDYRNFNSDDVAGVIGDGGGEIFQEGRIAGGDSCAAYKKDGTCIVATAPTIWMWESYESMKIRESNLELKEMGERAVSEGGSSVTNFSKLLKAMKGK